MWNGHTTEYYLALKRKEMLRHVTTWMDLENMINEISLTTKDEYPLILGI